MRTFTEVELALGEIAGAVERFRAASLQLADASENQALAAQALSASTDACTTVATQLAGLVEGLSAAADALRAVDPPALWDHLRQAERDRRAENAQVLSELAHTRLSGKAVLRVAVVNGLLGIAATVLLALIVTGVIVLR